MSISLIRAQSRPFIFYENNWTHIPKSTSHFMPATCHAWVPDSQCPHRDLKHLDQAWLMSLLGRSCEKRQLHRPQALHPVASHSYQLYLIGENSFAPFLPVESRNSITRSRKGIFSDQCPPLSVVVERERACQSSTLVFVYSICIQKDLRIQISSELKYP